jgi:hypothetical protein
VKFKDIHGIFTGKFDSAIIYVYIKKNDDLLMIRKDKKGG